MAKKTIHDFHKMVAEGEKITYLTAYDYLTAKMVEKAGMDMILVGDSLGMVELGYETTLPVTLEDMIRHCQAVRRGAPNTFIVGDMTYMSYQVSDEQAVESAGRMIKEGWCDAVKLEGGGERMASRIKAINESGILVMGHIGLTPQSMGQQGGYKAQGRNSQAAVNIVKEAKRLEEAGAFSILVEAVPSAVGKAITDRANIPILGIGAGPYTHGQLLIFADMIGLFDNFTPKFVRQYANVNEIITNAFKQYYQEVKENKFPIDGEHTYKMKEEEVNEFLDLLEKQGI
ncbi:MAG: 3-methyl-2-oxobutanoate hydroxymethyltransferase [Clostridia bacterium]|jgi:3-methyl-2-oxobutanoate hydroxymethyltransferase|nr:3-methyl-2-oxobutanoate hydroxymethyltransferase [Clostridia bacterium]MDN5322707.1 3-methyl-2-oxobutanoate hydroxymethyltransferase [Clostridia bacterium]